MTGAAASRAAVSSRLWGAAAVLAFTAGAASMTASPAVADSDQCPSGSFCVGEKSSYRGDFRNYTSSNPNVGDYMNDRMTSYWDRTGITVSVYEHSNYVGCMFTIGPGKSEAAMASHFNDSMTSLRIGRGC
ncbi:peptidase inhibitor family I36 protein [Streptomyces sp. NBC_00825]|uniref:peptidase inhibitor family I36 protein n=1 Tax=unclassified Streptomyces TaxID=2593676 RepID=UPI0022574776|nr:MULTISPECIES: peptidase inhibitor family I36 protein [unclassified Streptomyces]WTB59209.1 peptidase inhibitor family I36 protein [Streptomyces sp. NBC_00826]WTH87917.1 peptidase inhibitor family I36 protein [Streptomyces sp. NBC_00825]WTH96644.1 peptidase inhibitor family I36 protein [Streptomyces sp. NBC_00822]MCX4870123.1 peptidase inhibitor family I36 protein [Streptomyces sp. NBC_00906]MCX4901286.1 peptidase inhibitor family I36 protein [Streptomyces sp. NBC_00892]